jgi:hypothetical protein
MVYGGTAHNRTVYASSPVGGSGFRSPRSFRCAQTFGLNIPTPLFRHILPALVLLRKPLFGLAKHRKQPTCYANLRPDVCWKNYGN